MNGNSEYVEGAKKLIAEGLRLKVTDNLIIVATESKINVAMYIVEAAKALEIDDILLIQTPEILRPITKVSETLSAAVTKAKALIHVIDRQPEEDFRFNRPLRTVCAQNRCMYCFLYDPVPCYLKEGINANYAMVEEKCKKIAEILEESERIDVKTDLGTSFSFSIYNESVEIHGPVFAEDEFIKQAPDGEVSACPVSDTFNGKVVVDGPITSVGPPTTPISWTFKDGKTVGVDGDERFLGGLLGVLKRADKMVCSLIGIWIAEFAIGGNEWAVLDDNISNSEKVVGTIHIGMGRTDWVLGPDRGETFHFDSVITNCTMHITTMDGRKIRLLESGRLTI